MSTTHDHASTRTSMPASARLPAPTEAMPVAVGKALKAEAPSWLVSFAVHLFILLILAFHTLPLPSLPQLALQMLVTDDPSVDVETLSFESEVTLNDVSATSTVETPIDPVETLDVADELDSMATALGSAEMDSLEALSDLASVSAGIGLAEEGVGAGGLAGSGLEGRRGAARARLVRAGGGTRQSEQAVDAGLEWIARHQLPDGSWNFDHRYGECNGRCADAGNMTKARGAATGLALLGYLGAGHTHEEGEYRRVVKAGIGALVKLMKRDDIGLGYWDSEGKMYSHGIATMALCEAYAMTGDSLLRDPAQAALNYIVAAQDPQGGGWRYEPRQAGDTSVMGWQLSALKSGYLSGLSVPESVVSGASYYLDSVEENGGANFAYTNVEEQRSSSNATTAIGVLSRMFLGADRNDPRIAAAVTTLSNAGPAPDNFYYNYYAAQALFHYTGGQGEVWKKWNEAMREQLISSQASEDHEKGSWKPVQNDHGMVGGGRLYATALGAMTLEVYYRMLPIYKADAVDKKFDE